MYGCGATFIFLKMGTVLTFTHLLVHFLMKFFNFYNWFTLVNQLVLSLNVIAVKFAIPPPCTSQFYILWV